MNTQQYDVAAFGKVAVLMGGRSAERRISLMSGEGVLGALRARGVDAHAFDPAQRDLSELKREGFARCFIALHGRFGEDGTVQGALELLNIPYTGPGVMASSLCMDKTMTKRIWIAAGLPTPRFVTLRVGQQGQPHVQQDIRALGLPLIVKPPHEGSSIGVIRLEEASGLDAAIADSAAHEDEVMCEEFIAGEELTCALLGCGDDARALPLIRIQAPGGAYDYQHKYFTDDVRYLCPSGLPQHEEDEIRALALSSYRVLGCRGWGRVDVMLRASDRRPFLLEMNTAPGMTSHSLVPMAARVAGMAYEDLCLFVLAQATLDNAATHAGEDA